MASADFLITSLVVVLIPGTGVIYTISNGLFLGRRASIAAAVGCTAGIVPHLAASILGLSAILHMSAVAFHAVKYAGAIYLLYLAWIMWRETGSLQFQAQSSAAGMRQIALRGFLINILNPKLSIFFLAFLPLFISDKATSATIEMLFLGAIFMAMTLFIFIIYGISANFVRKQFSSSPAMTMFIQRTFASTFAALGVKLALTEQ